MVWDDDGEQQSSGAWGHPISTFVQHGNGLVASIKNIQECDHIELSGGRKTESQSLGIANLGASTSKPLAHIRLWRRLREKEGKARGNTPLSSTYVKGDLNIGVWSLLAAAFDNRNAGARRSRHCSSRGRAFGMRRATPTR